VVLFDISTLPTPENSAIHLHPADNVALARVPLAAGTVLRVNGGEVTVRGPVPAGHKVALSSIPAGGAVIRYGQIIGRARETIRAGEHVHTANLGFEERPLAGEFPAGEAAPAQRRDDGPSFLGYVRSDGRVGTRNYIAVVAASNCAAHTAAQIARSYEGQTLPPDVDGIVAFPHGDGCGHGSGPDVYQMRRTLGGVLAHPNVSAAVILGLGCEDNQIEHYLGGAAPNGGRLVGLTLQSSGGTRATVDAARRQLARLLDQAAAEKRTPAPASRLVVGLNCGGSDSFSGITANPALGHCSDLLAQLGGTPVLAETTEIVGAEHLLVRRARNRQVAEKLLTYIRNYKKYLNQFGCDFNDNPSPGNKAGGLSNIVEKSLGAVAKGGTSTLMDVFDYAEPVTTPGFCFMNTPGYDPVSLTGLAAGGCNLIAFTTGRGSAIGFPIVPVIKIVSNSQTWRAMTDNMDVNAGRIADGEATVEQVGREIFELLLEVASGRRTSAERLGHQEFVPWRIGPVV
jgi:altronate hydrolase